MNSNTKIASKAIKNACFKPFKANTGLPNFHQRTLQFMPGKDFASEFEKDTCCFSSNGIQNTSKCNPLWDIYIYGLGCGKIKVTQFPEETALRAICKKLNELQSHEPLITHIIFVEKTKEVWETDKRVLGWSHLSKPSNEYVKAYIYNDVIVKKILDQETQKIREEKNAA